MKLRILSILVIFALFSQAGCAFQRVYTAPPWIFKTPQSKDYVYVVGSAGRSISPWESKEMAIQDALVKLAQTVGTDVFSREINREYEGQKWGGGSVIKTSTRAALRHAKLVEFWADPRGKTGLGYQVYVLMRLNKKFLK